LSDQYGGQITNFDLSHNDIQHIGEGLNRFTRLKTLVLSSNQLESHQPWPRLATLTSLSLNGNRIDDLRVLCDDLSVAFPTLSFLSLFKNPACPNYFTGKDHDDYQRYRLYVLNRLPSLRFLDSTPVSEPERKEAERVGHLQLPASKPVEVLPAAVTHSDEPLPPPLPSDTRDPGSGPASFGRTRYVYYGKQSEGNRFILNSDL